MAFLVPFMIVSPLLGSLLNGLVFRFSDATRSGLVATICASVSFLSALALTSALWNGAVDSLSFSEPWLKAGDLELNWAFQFDRFTALMTLVVTGIGSLIHLFSMGYMSHEKGAYRYFAYLNLFLAAMLVLITAANLPVLFVGWEGVGLCSYLLIGYWFKDLKKTDAGMKAFWLNRIGDAGFLIGMFILFRELGTLNIQGLAAAAAGQSSNSLLPWAGVFLLIGATGKSAQIPLFTWLPDAMAGPTPVSALIHAATMVTAGIYLICRMSFLYELFPQVGFLVAWVGCGTAFLAASIAIAQRDIKKVLAYSTVSQLGFMFVALGVGAYTAAVFHLMTHAFFKALLFLGSGSIIHALDGEQDICNMGGLRKKLPITFWTFAVGVVAIAGLPPLSGFFSKDTIVFAALSGPRGSTSLWILMSVTSLMTAFYMSRLFFLVFFGNYRGSAHPHESPWIMWLPLVVLAIGSAVTGFLGVPHGLHLMPNFLDEWLIPILPKWNESHVFISEIQGMGIAIALAAIGIALAAAFYLPGPEKSVAAAKRLSPLHSVLANKYWIDELYDAVFVKGFRLISQFCAKVLDKYVVDACVLLPARIAKLSSVALSFVHFGAAQFYLWFMVIGGLAIFWFTLRGVVL